MPYITMLTQMMRHLIRNHKVKTRWALIEDVQTKDERATMRETSKQCFGFVAKFCLFDESLTGQDYDRLSSIEKKAKNHITHVKAMKPITEAEIEEIRMKEQPWLPCKGCPNTLVAQSDVLRHVIIDHMRKSWLKCNMCGHKYTSGSFIALLLCDL